MALQNFVDNSLPTIKAAWLNSVDLIQNVVTGSAGGIAVTGTLYVSGVSSFAAGSFGAPSIYMTGYATTGWYNIGANNWGFAVSGSKVLDIASTGLSVTGALSATGVANFLGESSIGITIRSNGLTTEEFNGIDNILVNYKGYANGTTQFRQFLIYDGKTNQIAAFTNAGLAVTGTLSASGTSTLARINQSNGIIDFSSLGNGSTSWQIGTVTAGKPLDIFIGGSVRAQFSDTGLAVTGTTSTTTGMAVGGATAGAGGIAFPATAVAVVDVNTLDDYEEGTFTPAISAGAGSITASSATGSYTKIGNRVFYEVVLTITTNGTGASSLIFTLPFTAAQQHTPVGINTSSAETCVGISTTTDVGMRTYSGLYPVSSGHVLRVSGNYIV